MARMAGRHVDMRRSSGMWKSAGARGREVRARV